MGRIFRRLVCLLLGAILGITSIIATAVTSVYYMYGELPVGGIVAPGKEEELGDLNDYSLEDILALLNKGTVSPENSTIADLEEKYGFELIGLINSFSNGETNTQFIKDLKSISIFTLFSEEGMSRFLADLPVGAVLGFIPEDTLLSPAEREKLRSYSIGQLIATDEATGQLGVISALGGIKLGGILPQLFEDGNGDGIYSAKDTAPAFFDLIANVEFSALINIATGKSSIGDEFVEGGLSKIGEMKVGDIIAKFTGEESSIAHTVNNLFNQMQIKDLFEKDIETGKNVFVVDKLLDNIKLGALLGLEKDENGVWCEKNADGSLGEPAKGIIEQLAELDLTTLFHVLTSDDPIADKIHNVLLVVGDLTVGDVFETLGFKQDEDGSWLKKDGTPVKSELAVALLGISIKDIVGEKGEKLSANQIRLNLVEAISKASGEMTIGEGLGELFGVEVVNGEYVYSSGNNAGKKVPVVLSKILGVEVSDLINCFGGEKVDLSSFVEIVEKAISGTTVGELLGATYENGKWLVNGNEVGKINSIIYDLDLTGIFTILKQMQSDEFSYATIVESFLPELSIGDIVKAILPITSEGED